MDKTPEKPVDSHQQQMDAMIDSSLGKRGASAAARTREKEAADLLESAGAVFAPSGMIQGPLQHISGRLQLAAGFVLHRRQGVLERTGLLPATIRDDGIPRVRVFCVGILDDRRAVRFDTCLSTAQALGTVPPDDNLMADTVTLLASTGKLEWWGGDYWRKRESWEASIKRD
jgi:hypothetical protein